MPAGLGRWPGESWVLSLESWGARTESLVVGVAWGVGLEGGWICEVVIWEV